MYIYIYIHIHVHVHIHIHMHTCSLIEAESVYIYQLDTVSKGSTVFRNPRALGCSVPGTARALLRAREFLNTVDPIGHSI